ncbi:MAG: aconitase X, partial [Anaerolineales bacterium]
HSAFQGREPEDIIDLTMGDLRAARAELTTALGDQLDMVALGCPHFSIDEFKKLAALADGKQAHPQVLFHITTNRLQLEQASQNGYLEPLQNFGARFTTDTCILATPMLNQGIRNLMTNSGKYAYYSPGMLNTKITYGSLADCVRSAVAGRIIQEGRLWEG